MVFSGLQFLFFFLPLLIIFYFLTPRKYRNYILLIFSLVFYFLGEKWYVILLLFSSLVNYIIGILLEKNKRKIYLVIGLVFNLGLLFYFKYTNFFIENFNNFLGFNFSTLKIILPLGISFYTFQNISYIVDVYRSDIKSEKSFLNYATYITLFPQLVAGPIVRYKDVKEELISRKESVHLFSEGIIRFTTGLGKKIIIADTVYNMYTTILKSDMSMLSYLLVALGFTFQIYYDFSGYSDMAIGLGKMFGFNFKENFNYPLIAKSITDFWRRWHMSLSEFFRDYVYIPLGGNRVSKLKHIRNIFIVWLLTGLWHGASWNFIIWGLYFCAFLILEKFFLNKFLKGGVFSHIYTFIVILISFVLFSITDLSELITFIKGMFGIGVPFINRESIYYLKICLVLFLICFIGMSPYLKDKIKNHMKGKIGVVFNVLEVVYFLLILILSVSLIISSSFNPFIYFRF